MARLINMGIVVHAHLPAHMRGDTIRLRRLRLLDGPFISNGLKDHAMLKANGLSKRINLSWLSLWWWMRKTHNCIFCIEVDSKRIGFVGLYNLIPGTSAEISLVIFDKMFRRQGHGTEAFRLLMHHAKRRSLVKEIHAKIAKDNLGALLFWEKAGFLEVKTLDDTIEYVYLLG